MTENKRKTGIISVLGVAFLALTGVGLASYLKAKHENESLAASRLENCQTAVKKNSRYPSKTTFTGTPSLAATRISGTVEFMNGFGAMIPFKYKCTFYSDSSVDLQGDPQVLEDR